MRNLVVTPKVKYLPGRSFKGVKSSVVPMQSMTLREIVQRFTRKESLPLLHDGVYITGMGDLEKIAREDLHTMTERAARLKERLELYEKKKQEAADKEKEKERKAAAAAPHPNTPPPQDMAKSAGGVGGGERPDNQA